jgi:hypothetical protein
MDRGTRLTTYSYQMLWLIMRTSMVSWMNPFVYVRSMMLEHKDGQYCVHLSANLTGNQPLYLPLAFMLVSYSSYSCTLKMEVTFLPNCC